MMQVTDMIVDVRTWQPPQASVGAELSPIATDARSSLLDLMRADHPQFLRYYEHPKPGTLVCSVRAGGELVGAVLLETKPDAAESDADAALACLVITKGRRGQGIGSAAIAACVVELRDREYTRVIAEWVASIPLYESFGFRVWKRREIDDS